MISASPLPIALGASLLLHGALLSSMQVLPGGWQVGPTQSMAAPAPLQARLGNAAPAVLTSQKPAPRKVAIPAAAPGQPGASLPAGDADLGVGPTYYATHLLDERPQVRSHIEPRFPDAVVLPGGRVVIELYINERGSVDDVMVTEAQPSGFFESAALEAFGAAQFRPGFLAGVAVKSRMLIEVLFGAPVPLEPALAASGGQYE